jgi:hypothetical protein
MTQNEKLILRETANLLKSEKLLKTPPEDMSDEEVLAAWSVLDLIDKEVVGARKDQLRKYLMELAESKGSLTPKGHFEYQPPMSDGTITQQKKSGKTSLDVKILKGLLVERNFDIEKIMTKVVDEAKVEALVALGEISPAEIKACSSIGAPTFALIVKKPSEVIALIPKTLKSK